MTPNFIVRTETSLHNLNALGLSGHVGTDIAWTFQDEKGAAWARQHLIDSGWDGKQPLMGVAPLNPFCWPVRPSLWRWLRSIITRDFSQQYDKLYYFTDSQERRQQLQHYLAAMAAVTDRYCREHHALQ